MIQIIYVAFAGAVGALCRWGTGRMAARLWGTDFPYGTLIVNVIGCFLIGIIMHIGLTTTRISETTRIAVTVGFLGALTTFSSFGYETITMAEQGRWFGAASNILLNVLLSLVSTTAGLAAARLMTGGSS